MEYIVRNIEKLHIYDLLGSGILDDFFVLLTCVDSNCDVAGIIEYHQCKKMQPAISYKKLGTAAIFECDELKKAAEEYKMLNGFDEIWCFRNMPMLEKPPTVILSGVEIVQTEEVIAWMQSSGCAAGIGDGLGANCITCESSIDEFLKIFELRQSVQP